MHFYKPAALLAGSASAALAALPARIYLHSPSTGSSIRSSASTPQDVSITAPEANAILSHHLSISDYEVLPPGLAAGSKTAQLVFGSQTGNLEETVHGGEGKKVVIVVYGSDGKDIVPDLMKNTTPLAISSPPVPQAWDALITTHINRFLNRFSLSLASLTGVHDFLTATHGKGSDSEFGFGEWAKEFEGSVAEWIEWGEQKLGLVKTQVESKEEYSRWLTEANLHDSTAQTLFTDLARLDAYASALPLATPLTTLRLTGLIPVARAHTRSSHQHAASIKLLQQALSAVVAATLATDPDATVILLTVPEAIKHHRHGQKMTQSLLERFKTSEQSFKSAAQLARRSEVFGSPKIIPLIHSSRKCYDSAEKCSNASGGCNGHGNCVQGHRTIGGTCYVCQCGVTTEGSGKKVGWSGDTCQKKDISSDFVLLAGSTIGLLVLFSASVAVLYGIGSEELPQQLASVSSSSKKMD